MRLLKYISEGIIDIDIFKFEDILLDIDGIDDKNILFKFNKELKKYGIEFVEVNKAIKSDLIQGSFARKNGNIVLYVYMPYIKEISHKDNWVDYFVRSCVGIINHELVHRQQFKRMNIDYLKSKWKDIKITDDPHELMAYAQTILYEIWNSFMDKKENIKDFDKKEKYLFKENVFKWLKMSDMKNLGSETYDSLYKELNKEGKQRLLKYLYQYLNDFVNNYNIE